MSMLKRQREVKKNEKAAHKRAKKHGSREPGFAEPVPTVAWGSPVGVPSHRDDGDEADALDARDD